MTTEMTMDNINVNEMETETSLLRSAAKMVLSGIQVPVRFMGAAYVYVGSLCETCAETLDDLDDFLEEVKDRL